MLSSLCPELESLRLCASFEDTFDALSNPRGFRRLRALVIGRVATMKEFERPLENFGETLVGKKTDL